MDGAHPRNGEEGEGQFVVVGSGDADPQTGVGQHLGRTVGHDAALVEDDDPVAGGLGLGQEVGAEQNGGSRTGRRAPAAAPRSATVWRGSSPSPGSSSRMTSGWWTMAAARATRWRWPLDSRPANRAASWPAPVRSRASQRRGPSPPPGDTGQGGQVGHVAERRVVGIERRRFGHVADPGPSREVGGRVTAVELDRSRPAREQAGHAPQQGRLPCSVGSEQPEDLASHQVEVHPMEHGP